MERLELINEVKSLIDMWMAANATRNITGFARESGVSESCVRRLYNNATVPQNDNLMKMLTVLSGQSSIEGLKKHFDSQKNICKFLLSNYSFLETSPFADSSKLLLGDEDHLQDFMSFAIYSLVSNRTPITQGHIKAMFGMMGDITLTALIEKKMITVNELGFLVPKTASFRLSKELIKKHLPNMVDMFFKTENKFNAYLLHSETVSKKGYCLAMDAFEKYMSEIGNIVINNPGEVPLVTGAFLDTMTLDQYFKGDA